jgi:hypothetical protein
MRFPEWVCGTMVCLLFAALGVGFAWLIRLP